MTIILCNSDQAQKDKVFELADLLRRKGITVITPTYIARLDIDKVPGADRVIVFEGELNSQWWDLALSLGKDVILDTDLKGGKKRTAWPEKEGKL
ncbi:hypothetical protein FACS1894191_8650 [Clostridia bacterium]|nr:hypothetical protein FACS1894191_8650 [Clostridia bacterium]